MYIQIRIILCNYSVFQLFSHRVFCNKSLKKPKGVIRSRKSKKNRQHKDQKKKYKQWYKALHRKLKGIYADCSNVEDPPMTVKCWTSTKPLFLYFNLCLRISHVHLHPYPFILINYWATRTPLKTGREQLH